MSYRAIFRGLLAFFLFGLLSFFLACLLARLLAGSLACHNSFLIVKANLSACPFTSQARMHLQLPCSNSISGLVVEYIVAIDVTRVLFPADA